MLKKPKTGWIATIAIGVALAIPVYLIAGIGSLFWQIRANEAASRQLAESLREMYPKPEVRGSSGVETISIRVIGAADDREKGEIMDWLHGESERKRLVPIYLELDHQGQFWLDKRPEGRVWRKHD